MATQTEQQRSAITVDGVQKFELAIACLDKGDLPSQAIFVLSIDDPDDPKEDTFARVATIADFTDLGTDRVAAAASSGLLYRVTAFTFLYDDLDTAVNAQDVIKSRIDELVEDWATYQTQFVTVSETVDHPQLDQDTFNSLVSAHTSATTALTTATATRDTAKTAYDTAVATASTAAADVVAAQTRADDCARTKQYFDDLLTAFSLLDSKADGFASSSQAGAQSINSKTFRDAAQAFRDAATGTPPSAGDKATFDTAKTTFDGQITTFDGQLATFLQDLIGAEASKTAATANQALFAAVCGARQSELATAQTAKTTADADVEAKRTAYEDAQAAVDVAQQAQDAALAAVRVLKPDWDPAT